jgi:hypothetical protein
MLSRVLLACLALGAGTSLSLAPIASTAYAQDASQPLRLAQSSTNPGYYRYDRGPSGDPYADRGSEPQDNGSQSQGRDDSYRPPRADAWRAPPGDERYANQAPYGGQAPYGSPAPYGGSVPYGQPYSPPGRYDQSGRDAPYYPGSPERRTDYDDGTYSMREIRDAGHGFFGSVSQGLASVIEYAFKQQGRPNGYILGEDLGGAFIAGLRYGEGWLYTRDVGRHKVFWQGPSLGYDAGAEGSKVMVLVYNLRDPSDIYHRFGGVAGSAYFVGGVGITFQTYGHVVLAPIRSGLGLRLGANVGYLKYTPRPTWNPF